ncbi:unnamed protein product [Symbiodinium sp. KB8]|nr:unnamed protein product [Symbiodinium sp. KB8]
MNRVTLCELGSAPPAIFVTSTCLGHLGTHLANRSHAGKIKICVYFCAAIASALRAPERGPCRQQSGPQEEQEQTQPPSLQPSRAKPAPTRVVPGLPVMPDRADESRVNRELVSMPVWQAISDNFDVPCAVRGHIQIAYSGNSMQQCAQKRWHVQRKYRDAAHAARWFPKASKHLLTAAELAPGNAATLAALTDTRRGRRRCARELVPAELQQFQRLRVALDSDPQVLLRWTAAVADGHCFEESGRLQQAFDRLGWTLVQEALIDAQVPVELRGQLLDFYRFAHATACTAHFAGMLTLAVLRIGHLIEVLEEVPSSPMKGIVLNIPSQAHLTYESTDRFHHRRDNLRFQRDLHSTGYISMQGNARVPLSSLPRHRLSPPFPRHCPALLLSVRWNLTYLLNRRLKFFGDLLKSLVPPVEPIVSRSCYPSILMATAMDNRELQLFTFFMTPTSGVPGGSLMTKRRRGATDGEDEELFFTSTEDQRQGQRQGKGKGKNQSRGHPGYNAKWDQGHYEDGLLRKVATLLVRHELSLQNLQMDTRLHFYMRGGAQSFLPNLYGIATEWSRLRQEDPTKISSPLRVVRMKAVLQEMATRARLILEKEQSLKNATELKWIVDGSWSYMKWNRSSRRSPAKPLPPSELQATLQELSRLIDPDSVRRFAYIRTLVENPVTEWVHFVLELGLREDGGTMWRLLLRLINNSALHPLGARLRCDRFRYDSRGQVFNHFQALDDLSETVRIPLFTSSRDLVVQWKPYQVRAALLHTGEAATRGHYRSLLRNGENIWHITDDNMSAALQPSSSLHRVSASAYVLICTEVSG